MADASDSGWPRYPETILRFMLSSALEVDLRQRVPTEVRTELNGLFSTDGFAVVTPCNPRGATRSEGENRTAVARLREVLVRENVAALEVEGMSVDRRHTEGGFAVAVQLPEAIELATRLEQSALFWFDGTAFWLVPALVQGNRLRLPPEDRTAVDLSCGEAGEP